MKLLACAGAAETMTSQWSPREKLQLVLCVKSLSLQEMNMLFDCRSPHELYCCLSTQTVCYNTTGSVDVHEYSVKFPVV